MARVKPIDSFPEPRGTEADYADYRQACRDFQRFFPAKLSLETLKKLSTDMKRDNLITNILGKICGFLFGTTTEDGTFVTQEFRSSKRACAEYWVRSLHRHCPTSTPREQRLDDQLLPAGEKRKVILVLSPYYLYISDILAIITAFAKNIKEEVDKSPDGLVVIPRDSHGIEVRIKKDDRGYYLA